MINSKNGTQQYSQSLLVKVTYLEKLEPTQ